MWGLAFRRKTILERIRSARLFINQNFPHFSPCETGWKKRAEKFDLQKNRADLSRFDIVCDAAAPRVFYRIETQSFFFVIGIIPWFKPRNCSWNLTTDNIFYYAEEYNGGYNDILNVLERLEDETKENTSEGELFETPEIWKPLVGWAERVHSSTWNNFCLRNFCIPFGTHSVLFVTYFVSFGTCFVTFGTHLVIFGSFWNSFGKKFVREHICSYWNVFNSFWNTFCCFYNKCSIWNIFCSLTFCCFFYITCGISGVSIFTLFRGQWFGTTPLCTKFVHFE